ncbi:MAG TPA: glycosyltransferase [Xanthomonadaceae bacterium]|jgi:glycosyltransferase involved in cell wall biosynthesis
MSDATDVVEVSDQARLVAAPLVSVLMITYNHADYLAEAIEGVVSQRCDFSFELIIGEDASKDATLEVALACQRRHPELVRVIHSPANVGMMPNMRRIFARARGEFVAYCEGDDYWCFPDKLARQVELMRGDPSVGIVHADWVRTHSVDGAWRLDPRGSSHRRVPLRLLQGDLFRTWHYPKILRTCTVLLRRETMRELHESALARKTYRFGDSVRNAWVTSKWKVAYLPEAAAVYRHSENSALRSGARSRVGFYKSCLEFDSDARAFFAGRGDYDAGYRWESAMALLLWSFRARDGASARLALKDLWRHFGPIGFVVTGCRTLFMRRPTLRRQARTLPRDHPAAAPAAKADPP